MPTDAELMKQMAEALKAIARQAKLAKPSSLMVPLIEDAEDALAAYRQHQAAPAKGVCPECKGEVIPNGYNAGRFIHEEGCPVADGTGKREEEL